MRLLHLSLIVLFAPSLAGQRLESTSLPLEPGALIQAALAAAGGINQFRESTTFQAIGTFTRNPEDKDFVSKAKITARFPGDFRIDIETPKGPKTIITAGEVSSMRNEAGSTSHVPLHNKAALALPFLFFARLAAAANDPTIRFSNVEQFLENDTSLYRVQVERNFGTQIDPSGNQGRVESFALVLDVKTLLPVRLETMARSDTNLKEEYPKKILFADYRIFDGRLIPTRIEEQIEGTRIWTLVIEQAGFGVALSSADFQF